MKKFATTLFFAAAATVGALISYAAVFGLFQAFGVGTEIFLLSLGFVSAVLFSYASVKVAVS